jgi:hypothetical protein
MGSFYTSGDRTAIPSCSAKGLDDAVKLRRVGGAIHGARDANDSVTRQFYPPANTGRKFASVRMRATSARLSP